VDQEVKVIQVCTTALPDKIPVLLTRKISSIKVATYRIGKIVGAIKAHRAHPPRVVEVVALIGVGTQVISSGSRV
jgi:hypothetical protein